MSQTVKINDYDTFQCTADQCTLSCCQEWRIGVDENTLKKWDRLKIKKDTLCEQSEIKVCDHVQEDETGHKIQLNKDKKCPFLNEKKLCKLVIEHGDEYLSEACTTFPRVINRFEDRIEYSLDTGCPVVIDRLRDQKEKSVLHKENPVIKSEPLLYEMREVILTIVQDEQYTLPQRMMSIFYVLLELLEEKKLTDKKLAVYKDTKQLAPLIQAIQKMNFNVMDSFWEGNELFLDVVDNYRKEKLYVNYLEPIATLAESLEAGYTEKELKEKKKAFNQVFKAYEKLIEKYLASEIIGNSLLQEMTLYDMTIQFQWITLVYATVRQALFLKWLKDDESVLAYETVRDYLAIMSRVTGYEQGDIREYLENSFEEILWEWGYLALVTGNEEI